MDGMKKIKGLEGLEGFDVISFNFHERRGTIKATSGSVKVEIDGSIKSLKLGELAGKLEFKPLSCSKKPEVENEITISEVTQETPATLLESAELIERLAAKRFERLKEQELERDFFLSIVTKKLRQAFLFQIQSKKPVCSKDINMLMARQLGLTKRETRKLLKILEAKEIAKPVKRGFIISL